MSEIKKWKTLNSEELCKTPFFRLRKDRCELPNNKIMPNYYVMEWLPWVNIVALTSEKEIILIEQYRHGGGNISVEIPGGSMDPNPGETPLIAAKRELLEETGYSTDQFKLIGSHKPNPAIQDNELHTFLALNCKLVSAPHPDPFEFIRVFTSPIKTTFRMIERGEINHSLIIASLYMAKKHLPL